MIFLNPWAWIGLAALAGPIAAHLFARRRAQRHFFPTLRFLPASRLAPVRRDRLTDRALLALRCAIVFAAVFALAQPACRASDGTRDAGTGIARAIVIDTSASMTREAAAGVPAVETARREAADLAAAAAIARVVESETPADVIAASVAWLETQSMRREVAIVSDFQRGQISPDDLTPIPHAIGVRPVPISARGVFPAVAAAERAAPGVTMLAGAAEQAGATAAWQAAVARGAPVTGAADRPVAIVFPQYERRSTLIADAKPLDRPWMFEVIAVVSSDPLSYLYSNELSWIAGTVNDRAGVVLVTDVPADSLAAAALVGAAARAASAQPAAAELSPDVVSPAELTDWTREAAPGGSARTADPEPQGRWLWATALALLLVEGFVRRIGIATPREGRLGRAA